VSTPRELLGIRDDLAKKVAERQLDRHDAVADLRTVRRDLGAVGTRAPECSAAGAAKQCGISAPTGAIRRTRMPHPMTVPQS
jgi:hypothetical protein